MLIVVFTKDFYSYIFTFSITYAIIITIIITIIIGGKKWLNKQKTH